MQNALFKSFLGSLRRHFSRHGDKGARAISDPFAVFFLSNPCDVVFEGWDHRAVGSFHPGDLPRDVNDGDLFANVADVFNFAGVGGASHGAVVFFGEEFLDLGCAFGMPSKRVDKVAILSEETGQDLWVMFIPGGAPFVVALLNGSVLVLIGCARREPQPGEGVSAGAVIGFS